MKNKFIVDQNIRSLTRRSLSTFLEVSKYRPISSITNQTVNYSLFKTIDNVLPTTPGTAHIEKDQRRRRRFIRCSPLQLWLCAMLAGLALAGICAGIIAGVLKTDNKTTATTTTTTTTAGAGPCIELYPPYTAAWGYNRTFYGSEGVSVSISCVAPTPTLTLIRAFYGYNNASSCDCTKMDVTQVIQTKCNTTACSFIANNTLLTDTCYLVVKTFWMYYTCTV